MNDKPKRRWFQIHLSTAIALMFLAGIVLGLNMITRRGNRVVTTGNVITVDGNLHRAVILEEICGWPWEISLGFHHNFPLDATYSICDPMIPRKQIALNFLFSFALLGSSAWILEFTIRRRDVVKISNHSFWELHLGTVVLLMFVAAPLLGLNLWEREIELPKSATPVALNSASRIGISEKEGCGWPFQMRGFTIHHHSVATVNGQISLPIRNSAKGIIGNILVAVAILTATALGCEWAIRCRASRRSV